MCSATPTFLLKLIFGYAPFGDAQFSFEVIFGYAFCSAMLNFLLKLFSAMPFFGYARNCVLYLCFYFPPLYANRSNAIGGEGRFFYVFLYFRQSL